VSPPPAKDTGSRDEHKASPGIGVTAKTFTAHVIRIEHGQSGLLLHLDNGQIWREVQSVAGDLSLRPGDTVQIEKHLGSFWLTGPHVYGMSIRPK
jgi:hypothetical protein